MKEINNRYTMMANVAIQKQIKIIQNLMEVKTLHPDFDMESVLTLTSENLMDEIGMIILMAQDGGVEENKKEETFKLKIPAFLR